MSASMASRGAWVCGPELALALKLGAHDRVQIGYRLRVLELDGALSRSMRAACVRWLRTGRWPRKGGGNGSLEEQTIKVATTRVTGSWPRTWPSGRGGTRGTRRWNPLAGSSVTSPYHAAMITSLVRALLLGMANEVALISVTTDGFITGTV